jgi:hypothetical protein
LLTSLDKELASGLQMTAMVEYHPNKNEDMSDHIFISVGNKVLDIPLFGYVIKVLDIPLIGYVIGTSLFYKKFVVTKLY